MILVDAGPLVALFDPSDGSHDRCVSILKSLREPLATTIPVLTEAFHLLSPASIGAHRLMDFIAERGLSIWFLDDKTVTRSFELMIRYADNPMDLADASIVAIAEKERIRRIFTIDRKDFAAYRFKRGHRYFEFEMLN